MGTRPVRCLAKSIEASGGIKCSCCYESAVRNANGPSSLGEIYCKCRRAAMEDVYGSTAGVDRRVRVFPRNEQAVIGSINHYLQEISVGTEALHTVGTVQ